MYLQKKYFAVRAAVVGGKPGAQATAEASKVSSVVVDGALWLLFVFSACF